MKSYHFLILFVLLTSCSTHTKINENLKKDLELILFSDQIYREYIDNNTTDERREQIAKLTNQNPEFLREHIFTLLPKIDSINFLKIENIIASYGYPGRKLVGEPANTTAFYIIQHNPDKIPKFYPIIEEAAQKGEIPFYLAAMMLDRKLVNEGSEQVYGSQVSSETIIDKQTGNEKLFSYVVPIKNAKDVNKRRKKAGFELTVEQNAKRLDVEYKVYTFEDLKKILE